jgi:NAD-dependent SIR2 family protein deacetylase
MNKFLETHICPECHVAILEEHPQEELKNQGFKKCPVCGFTKQIKKELQEVHKIIFGKYE